MQPQWLTGRKICVTGGTGFLGGHLLPILAECGAEITCITRATSATRNLPPGAMPVVCDLATGAGLGDALREQDILVHMASLLFGHCWQDYFRANVAACENIAAVMAALPPASRPKRIVLVSSLAACAPCSTPPGIAEGARPAPVSAYGWSKLLCENIFASAFGEKLVIVRPPIIYGSGDRGLLPMFRAAGRGFGASPGAFRKFPVSVIHAADASQAIVLATGPQASGVYHVDDGKPHDMDEICSAMGCAQGRPSVHVFHIPLAIMGCAAIFSTCMGGMWQSLRGMLALPKTRAPEWNIDKFREAAQCGWLADGSRIKNDLGFEARFDLSAGMAEAVAGYRARGWL